MRGKIRVVLCILAGSLISCGEMDDNYEEFFEGGEIVYPGAADSLQAHAGDYRLELSWLLTADPSISRSMIYWNNGRDSMEVNVTQNSGVDTIKVLLTGMEERAYTFQVYNYDNEGNISVSAEVLGTVYGDNYRQSLLNRVIKEIRLVDDDLLLVWDAKEESSVGQSITYKDKTGDEHQVFSPASEDSTLLADYRLGEGFDFQTLFLPDSLAIDTFLAPVENVALEVVETESEIDKSEFQLYELPGDYSGPNASSSGVAHVWTNSSAVNSPTYISKVDGHPLPQWFTIDLGAAYDVTRIKLFQRGNADNANRLYAGGNLREFEVWGAISPDPDYNPDDHGGDFGEDWTLLQSCTVNRPSGNVMPTGSTRSDNTEEDIEAAEDGHEFILEAEGKIRYIRIKGISNWDAAGRSYINIAAINFWAVQRELQRIP